MYSGVEPSLPASFRKKRWIDLIKEQPNVLWSILTPSCKHASASGFSKDRLTYKQLLHTRRRRQARARRPPYQFRMLSQSQKNQKIQKANECNLKGLRLSSASKPTYRHTHTNLSPPSQNRYTWPSSSNLTTAAILTDKDNNQHRTSLPKGSMRAEIWAQQLSHAKNQPPTSPPRASEQNHLAPRHARLHGLRAAGRTLPRSRVPRRRRAVSAAAEHTGQGTNFAAMEAMMLAQVFAGEMGPGEWNRRVVEASLKEQARAVSFASSCLDRGTGGSGCDLVVGRASGGQASSGVQKL